jgi:hypothetical protein
MSEEKELIKKFNEVKDIDFTYLSKSGTLFRINGFYEL